MTEVSRRAVVLAAGTATLSAVSLSRWAAGPEEPPGAPAGDGGTWAALGGVAVLRATWGTAGQDGHAGHAGHAGQHDGHAGHADAAVASQASPAAVPVPSPHAVWGHAVVVHLAVTNGTDRPVRLSAGQFRLRLDQQRTVSYLDAQHEVRTVAAGETLMTWVSFLAPSVPEPALLDYTAAGAARSVALPLAPLRHLPAPAGSAA